MFILITPILIPLLFIIGIILVLVRKYYLGAVAMISTIALNIFTESIPFHFNNTKTIDDNNIKILTYNIKYGNNKLKSQTDNFISFVKEQQADILVLPESWLAKMPEIEQELCNLYTYCITDNYKEDKKYIETYVFSLFPINNVERIGNYIYTLDINIGEDKILKLAACHLQSNQWHSQLNGGEGLLSNIHKAYEARNIQAQQICDSLSNWTGPMIVCGDMNDISGSESINILQEKLKLHDAWWKKGLGYGATFADKGLFLRLDHILFSPQFLSIQNVTVTDADFSDHYPLTATFTFN